MGQATQVDWLKASGTTTPVMLMRALRAQAVECVSALSFHGLTGKLRPCKASLFWTAAQYNMPGYYSSNLLAGS